VTTEHCCVSMSPLIGFTLFVQAERCQSQKLDSQLTAAAVFQNVPAVINELPPPTISSFPPLFSYQVENFGNRMRRKEGFQNLSLSSQRPKGGVILILHYFLFVYMFCLSFDAASCFQNRHHSLAARYDLIGTKPGICTAGVESLATATNDFARAPQNGATSNSIATSVGSSQKVFFFYPDVAVVRRRRRYLTRQ
jgi:hypothetical protein